MTLRWDDLIGRAFKYGGRPDDGPDAPLDCYGLVQEVSRRTGVALPDRVFSTKRDIIAVLMGAQMGEWERCEPGVGAVLLIRIKSRLCHVGIQIDEFNFLHTWEASGGVCRESISDWERRIEGYYRYVG